MRYDIYNNSEYTDIVYVDYPSKLSVNILSEPKSFDYDYKGLVDYLMGIIDEADKLQVCKPKRIVNKHMLISEK